ncbi:Checkpoint kinase 2 [Gaertneriomyces sp. JEL0708]|nr:Checkpoint kinase 2 [Gaertneriomyces sp. JEL0708]
MLKSLHAVKLAIDLRNGDHLACKIIDKHGQKTKARHAITQRHIESEMEILKGIRHPNIVPVQDIVVTDTHVCIFMTKISGGELFDYIHRTNGLEEPVAKFMFYQTLLAVQYLHRRNITHRDLKPENILLTSEEEISRLVITDFGLAKMLDPTLARMKTKCGTLSYLAPEVLDSSVKGGYSKHVDCWSLGVLLFKMLAGYLPFGDEGDTVSLMERVRSGKFNFGQPQWKGISVQGKDMIRRFLEVDPLKRLTVDEALRHPWIASQKPTLLKLYRRYDKRHAADRDVTAASY